jgi:predicted O-methyltransferase YrrM
MPSSFQVKSYLQYWLDAVDSHSLHSPFFYEFYTNVLKKDLQKEKFASAEALRDKLLQNPTPIIVHDLGAGSRTSPSKQRRIDDIAKHSLSPSKFSRLYARIVDYYDSSSILELGTSFGINALFLAASPDAKVVTFEGSPSVASVARSTFEFADARNINLVEGDIGITLPRFLLNSGKIDFVFMDANHRRTPTMEYFNHLVRHLHTQSIVIMDDIHYSPEMEEAWKAIKAHAVVYGSVDLYRCGILFFDPSLNKQHVVLQF